MGGVRFDTTAFDLMPGDRLLLYTDGLVETRDQPIDERLGALLRALDEPHAAPRSDLAGTSWTRCGTRATTTMSRS